MNSFCDLVTWSQLTNLINTFFKKVGVGLVRVGYSEPGSGGVRGNVVKQGRPKNKSGQSPSDFRPFH